MYFYLSVKHAACHTASAAAGNLEIIVWSKFALYQAKGRLHTGQLLHCNVSSLVLLCTYCMHCISIAEFVPSVKYQSAPKPLGGTFSHPQKGMSDVDV